jgi:hypothetical protein
MRSFSVNRRRISLLAFAICCAVAAVIVVPHRFSTKVAQVTLQTGMKMEVQISLRSQWGWAVPTRLTGLRVLLDGMEIPIPAKAIESLQSLDPALKPVISERAGFPEVAVWGSRGSSMAEVRWRFLNYSLSERDVLKKDDLIRTYFTSSSLDYKQVALPALSSSRLIAMQPEKVKKSSLRDLSK